MSNIAVTEIVAGTDVVISYQGNLRISAWLEDTNKHWPYILSLNTDMKRHVITIPYSALSMFMTQHPGHRFKLSLCAENRRFSYDLSPGISTVKIAGGQIAAEDGIVVFSGDGDVCDYPPVASRNNIESFEIGRGTAGTFSEINSLPANTLVVGSCFGRSIFRSDAYFNPGYKKYFRVGRTVFHSSLISLFSEKSACDFRKYPDLVTGDAGKYIEVEFRKNLDEILEQEDFQILVIDNYMDAAVPVIRFHDRSYFTYNRYFAESVFKRFFASCPAVFPGSPGHTELFQKSAVGLRQLLERYHVKNIVLVGGRLSRYMIDEDTGEISPWDRKMDWINAVNTAWDTADRIFLKEFPAAFYLDMRNTHWKSDLRSPITGGVSPSHYQSGYYHELFRQLAKLTGKAVPAAEGSNGAGAAP